MRRDAGVIDDNEARKDSPELEFYFHINNSVPVRTPLTLNTSQFGPWPTCHTQNLNDKIEMRFPAQLASFSDAPSST